MNFMMSQRSAPNREVLKSGWRPVAQTSKSAVSQVSKPAWRPKRSAGFTLVEVVIASVIFCIGIFAILGVMSQGLRAAGALKNTGPTAGMVMADFSLTNSLEESSDIGSFGDTYPDYQWAREVTQAGSNGLFKIDVVVTHKGAIDSTLTTYLYRPRSPAPRR